jgi:hypothetical protein
MTWLNRQTWLEWQQSWRERWGFPAPREGQEATHREMFRGDSLVFRVQVFRPVLNDPSTLVPVDLTGFSMWCTLKYQVVDQDNQAVAQLTVGSGITYFNASRRRCSSTT